MKKRKINLKKINNSQKNIIKRKNLWIGGIIIALFIGAVLTGLQTSFYGVAVGVLIGFLVSYLTNNIKN